MSFFLLYVFVSCPCFCLSIGFSWRITDETQPSSDVIELQCNVSARIYLTSNKNNEETTVQCNAMFAINLGIILIFRKYSIFSLFSC